jgi:hypothetical protein
MKLTKTTFQDEVKVVWFGDIKVDRFEDESLESFWSRVGATACHIAKPEQESYRAGFYGH